MMAVNEKKRCLFYYLQGKRSRTAAAERAITIELLNDDCLIEIFTLLTPIDRTRIERVSKRWNYLSKKSWNHFKSIDCDFMKTVNVLQKKINNEFSDNTKIANFLKNKKNHEIFGLALDGVLSRSRNYVKTVDFDFSVIESKQVTDFFNLVIFYCKKLERFAIDEGIYSGDCDKLFTCLFKHNQKLRSVAIPNIAYLTGECLMALDANNLTEIHLRIDYQFIEMDILKKAFSNFVNLKILGIESVSFCIEAILQNVATDRRECKIEKLQIQRVSYETDDDTVDDEEQIMQERGFEPKYSKYFSKMKSLVKIGFSCVNLMKCSLEALPAESLTSIMLVYFQTNDYSKFLFFLKHCKNLKTFILHVGKRTMGHPIEDGLFDSLSRCEKLSYLHLVNCKNISDAGIAKLANLPDMRKLEVERSQGVTAEFVKSKFQHLEMVKINGAYL